jgi:hypothetical protein
MRSQVSRFIPTKDGGASRSELHSSRREAMSAFASNFPGVPIVLMVQDGRGRPCDDPMARKTAIPQPSLSRMLNSPSMAAERMGLRKQDA